MLLRFGVSNHLSIHGYQELSLGASSLKDRDDGLIDCPAVGSILPAVVIYGPNASGKSNLVDALGTMQSMVLYSQVKGEPGGGVPRHPFRLDEAASRQPSRFDLDFVASGVRYHYGLETSGDAFESEWLYSVPRSHRRILFERTGMEFRFGRGLKGQNRAIAGLTRPNSLFLSAAAQNGHEQLSEVFGYFRSIQSDRTISVPGGLASRQLLEWGIDERVITFLTGVDTGVIGYRKQETEVPEEVQTAQREILAVIKKVTGVSDAPEMRVDERQSTIELAHRGRDGIETYLELDRESAGTRRLLVVLGLAFRALDEGAPLLIDELDASLHTHAAEAVLKLFCSSTLNARGAQLVATTHDTNLLNSPMLRRDQVWFTEKDPAGATRLYPLTDIRTRKEDSIERGYLQGRYGAVPLDDPVTALG